LTLKYFCNGPALAVSAASRELPDDLAPCGRRGRRG